MDWKTVTFEDNKQAFHAKTDKRILSIHCSRNGKIQWWVYDETGDNLLASGYSDSVAAAKEAAETV